MELTNLSVEELLEMITEPNKVEKGFMLDGGFSKVFRKLCVESNLEIKNKEYQNQIIFDKTTFDKIEIENVIFQKWLWFKECTFNDDFIVYRGNFDLLHFSNCTFNKGLIIYDAEGRKLVIENSISSKPIKIKGGEFEYLYFESIDEKTHLNVEGIFTFFHNVHISSNVGSNISFKQTLIRTLEIGGNYNSSSKISLLDTTIYNLSFLNVNNDGRMYISNLSQFYVSHLNRVYDLKYKLLSDLDEAERIKSFLKNKPHIKNAIDTYNNFYLPSDLKEYIGEVFGNQVISYYRSYSVKPKFEIKYSSIGILELKNVDLSDLEVDIQASDLSNIKLINSTIKSVKGNSNENHFQIFNDLYTAANRQNNVKDKIEYYKESQEALRRNLIELRKKTWADKASIASITISNFYSSHGTNWLKAVFVTVVIIGVPFFILFFACFENVYFSPTPEGSYFLLKNLVEYLPHFINPVHKIDFMEVEGFKLSSFSGWIDILSRIFIGIGIFEIIRSFRKYIRS